MGPRFAASVDGGPDSSRPSFFKLPVIIWVKNINRCICLRRAGYYFCTRLNLASILAHQEKGCQENTCGNHVYKYNISHSRRISKNDCDNDDVMILKDC